MTSLTTAAATSALDAVTPFVGHPAPHTAPAARRRPWSGGLVGLVLAAVVGCSLAWGWVHADAVMTCHFSLKSGGRA